MYRFLFYFSRNHLFIKDDINHHEYFSEGLCGDRRSILVEIQSRRVVVRVHQHYQHVDVGFEGAYAIVKGDIGLGKFRSVCMNVLWNEWEKRDGWEHILYTRLPLLPGGLHFKLIFSRRLGIRSINIPCKVT